MPAASTLIRAAAFLKSFVVEEVAATHLLVLSWRPVYNELVSELEKVIDFRRGGIFPNKKLDSLVWHDKDLHDLIDKQWEAAAPAMHKYLTAAWRKGAANQLLQKSEDGGDPAELSAVDVLMASCAFFYKNNLWNNIRPDVERLVHMIETVPDLPNDVVMQITDTINAALEAEEYMATLGNLYVARAHHFAVLDYMQNNRIAFYQISAILDDRTCATCEELDGTVFPLEMGQQARDAFMRHATDLDALKNMLPFVTMRDVKGLDGKEISGKVNLALPPRHPGCRCIVVPVRSQ